jgi:CRP-like cAMP-binding protein
MLAVHHLSREEYRVLSQLPFFSATGTEEMDEIAATVRKRSYRRGEVIHHVDDVAGDVFVIVRGVVKHRLVASDGRQFTHSIQEAGAPFGLLSVIDQQRRAGDAVALTDCDVLVIDRDVFARFLGEHTEAKSQLLDRHVNSMRKQHSLVHDLAFLTVPMRLAKMLLVYSRGHADPASGQPVVPGYLNQTELAYLVGSTRETVNQCLKTFTKQGWISFDHRSIRILDADALSRMTD